MKGLKIQIIGLAQVMISVGLKLKGMELRSNMILIMGLGLLFWGYYIDD